MFGAGLAGGGAGCRTPRDVSGETPSARSLRAFVSYALELRLQIGSQWMPFKEGIASLESLFARGDFFLCELWISEGKVNNLKSVGWSKWGRPKVRLKQQRCFAGWISRALCLRDFSGLGFRSLGEGNGCPLLYSFPGEFHGQRSLVGYSLWGHRVIHDWVTNTFTFFTGLGRGDFGDWCIVSNLESYMICNISHCDGRKLNDAYASFSMPIVSPGHGHDEYICTWQSDIYL